MLNDSHTPDLFTPGEVARHFRVGTRTVSRWTRDSGLPSIRTSGGHRRIPRSAIAPYLQAERHGQP